MEQVSDNRDAKLAELRDKLRDAKDAYWSKQVDIQRQVATAWLLYAEGKRDDALNAMSAAADAEDKTEKHAFRPSTTTAVSMSLTGFSNRPFGVKRFQTIHHHFSNRPFGVKPSGDAGRGQTGAELYGVMLLESGNAKDALVAFEATLKKEPNRLGAYVGAAKAAEKCGESAKAHEYYSKVVAIADAADNTRTEVTDAHAFLTKR